MSAGRGGRGAGGDRGPGGVSLRAGSPHLGLVGPGTRPLPAVGRGAGHGCGRAVGPQAEAGSSAVACLPSPPCHTSPAASLLPHF